MKYAVCILFIVFFYPIKASERSLIIGESEMLKLIYDSNVIIIDVREKHLYQKSHIKNAINLPVSETFSKGKRTDLVAPFSEIVELFGGAGIERTSQVVLYDGGETINAARLFWVLETFGNQNVSIFNLGFDKWAGKNLPTSTTSITPKAVIFIPSVYPSKVSTYLTVRSIIDNQNHTLIDVRPEDEYLGIRSITGEYGHIPSAINIPFTQNLVNGSKGLLSTGKLNALYSSLDKSKPVTVYCNKGKQSALSYFVLRHLNYNVSAYDGSWFEWGSMQNLPKWQP